MGGSQLLKGERIWEIIQGSIMGVFKRETRSLDSSSRKIFSARRAPCVVRPRRFLTLYP